MQGGSKTETDTANMKSYFPPNKQKGGAVIVKPGTRFILH